QDEGNALAIDPTNGRALVAGSARSTATQAAFLVTRYVATSPATPVVSSVSPASGPNGGGSSVTITGSGFTGATKVVFRTTPAAGFTVNSDTKITATSPALASGSYQIRVTTPGGTSPAVPADVFNVNVPVPSITSISPSSGTTAGGTSVTING